MRVDEFDFELPEARIALRPATPRESAKLLHVNPHASVPFSDHIVDDLPSLLKEGDVLVFNNTRVLPSALQGQRLRNGAEGQEVVVSCNLLKRLSADTWSSFAKPTKRLKIGDEVVFAPFLKAQVRTIHQGEVVFCFSKSGRDLDEALEKCGDMPLPPYIATRRAADEQDEKDYQTIFAQQEGSVAAPTAGLHFTEALLAKLNNKKIKKIFVTLHVGAGTFLPVKVEDTKDHIMHSEWGEITPVTAEALNQARAEGRRIIAVGTTSLRLLETAAREGSIKPYKDETNIFITPGHQFRAVDALITNFHLPKSTLFMLVCAFAGTDVMKQAYQYAITNHYRFYSYGDTSLLELKKS